MRLQKRMFLVSSAYAIAAFLIISISLFFILGHYYAELDRDEAKNQMKSILLIINNEIDGVKTNLVNYSAWDDTYNFIEKKHVNNVDHDPYIISNYPTFTYSSNNFDFVAILSKNQKIIYGHSYDAKKNVLNPLPSEIIRLLNQNKGKLSTFYSPVDSIEGFVVLNDKVLLLVSEPIVTSSNVGPIRGEMVVGRYVTSAYLEKLDHLTRTKLVINKQRKAIPSIDFIDQQTQNHSIENSAILVNNNSSTQQTVTAVIYDLFDRPAFTISTSVERSIYQRGLSFIRVLALSICIFIGGLILILWSQLNQHILRIKKLVTDIQKIRYKQNFSMRVELSGNDEINDLQLEFNRMMTSLENAQEVVKSQSYRDPLTDLPNRSLFYQTLEAHLDWAKQNDTHFAVLFIDLDKFKSINDRYGHDVGDLLLKLLGQRLTLSVRADDIVSRLGGDEFTVLLKGIQSVDHAKTVTERIYRALSKPYRLGHREMTFTTSIGLSVYPFDGDDVQTLVSNADHAMLQVKEDGRNHFQLFSEQIKNEKENRNQIEHELSFAVAREQLFLQYQPQLNPLTGKVVGVEALVRWNHPTMGIIPPDKFITIAEETGQIVHIGRWVLQQACRDLASIHENGFPKLIMGINLSVVQLEQDDILELVRMCTRENGLQPEHLDLEITESTFMSNLEEMTKKLMRLRDQGFKVSIDDFGTGYSSLNYLRDLPFDRIKLDRSFIQQILTDQVNQTIARAIIELGHNLGKEVIAEGVEEEEQINILQNYQCDLIQGYFVSRPLGIENLLQFLCK